MKSRLTVIFYERKQWNETNARTTEC